jgi:hypothetical protein
VGGAPGTLLGAAALFQIVSPHAAGSTRGAPPTVAAQTNAKSCWFALCSTSAFPAVRHAGSTPLLHSPRSIPRRGRPLCGSTLREYSNRIFGYGTSS